MAKPGRSRSRRCSKQAQAVYYVTDRTRASLFRDLPMIHWRPILSTCRSSVSLDTLELIYRLLPRSLAASTAGPRRPGRGQRSRESSGPAAFEAKPRRRQRRKSRMATSWITSSRRPLRPDCGEGLLSKGLGEVKNWLQHASSWRDCVDAYQRHGLGGFDLSVSVFSVSDMQGWTPNRQTWDSRPPELDRYLT